MPSYLNDSLDTTDYSHGDTNRKILHVEIIQKPLSSVSKDKIISRCKEVISKQEDKVLLNDICINNFTELDPFLAENIESLSFSDTELLNFNSSQSTCPKIGDCCLVLHVFKLNPDAGEREDIDSEDDLPAAMQYFLPSKQFHGLWENLVYHPSIKQQLLQYANTTLVFSDNSVNSNVISWNRVILLHGPPGTGKTSLCKALAHKLSINLSDRYSYSILVEINSHSLFSKWFSESGKLVMKMFAKIKELLLDEKALVVVLMDEVESLTASRSNNNSSEPSDALRVVNAMLTQIDQIKEYPNALIMATSNITGAIDIAFVDRADIKQYIGPPNIQAIYSILRSCIFELIRTNIISPAANLFSLGFLDPNTPSKEKTSESNVMKLSLHLEKIARQCEGFSGRTLRKLPFISHATHIFTKTVTCQEFLNALEKCVNDYKENQKYFN